MLRTLKKLLLVIAATFAAYPAHANTQTPVDRADPSVVEEELREPKRDTRQKARPGRLVADPAGEAESALTRPVAVRLIRVEGASEIPSHVFRPAVEPFVGRTLGGRELSALASEVAEAARGAGYGLATAWIPEQTIERGVLRVQVDEGRIDDVKVSGDASALVRRMLAPLATGRPVRTADLERRLLLAGDLPGVSLGKPRLERVNGRNLLVVKSRRDAAQGRGYIDNWGSKTVGPVRAHLSVDLNGLLAEDDRLTLGGVWTPLNPTEFGLARAAYTKAVGTNGTEVTVGGYAARSRPGGELADRDFEGQSLEASIGVNHPFLRSRAASLWGDLEFSLRDTEQSRDDVTIRKDRFAILKASAYSTAQFAGGRARARLSLSQGLPIFGASREEDVMTSRADGSAVFSKLEFWGHYDAKVAGPLSIQLQAEAQIASRPLLSSEEMGLGGRYFLRGYDYREFSGDKGIAGSFELRVDLPKFDGPLRRAQLYGFADAGSVGNLEGGTGGGSLASAGGGIRAWIGSETDAALELGVPLSDGSDAEEELDPRISFVIGTRF